MDTQPPARLQSDNGKEFTANIVENLCKAYGVDIVHGAIGNPQAQGCVERCNQTFKNKLRAMLMLEPTIRCGLPSTHLAVCSSIV